MNDIPEKVIKAVRGGITSRFWVAGLRVVLNDYIAALTDRITGDVPMAEGEKREDLILKRRAYKDLLDLPQQIVEMAVAEDDGKPEGIPNDPYE